MRYSMQVVESDDDWSGPPDEASAVPINLKYKRGVRKSK